LNGETQLSHELENLVKKALKLVKRIEEEDQSF